MSTAITHIDWRDDGATVTATESEPQGIDANLLVSFIEDIHIIRHWTEGMTGAQRERLGPEVILLLRDVAPHLTCTPDSDRAAWKGAPTR